LRTGQIQILAVGIDTMWIEWQQNTSARLDAGVIVE